MLVPLLDRPLPEVLGAGELRVVWEGQAFAVAWHEHRWPLSPAGWRRVLGPLARRRGLPGEVRSALRDLLRGLGRFRPPSPPRAPPTPPAGGA